MARLQKLTFGRRPEIVAETIAQRILSGEFKRDQSLPSERELSETFGVSRNAIREAVRMLQARGLVQTRQGRRTVVTADTSKPVRQVWDDVLAGKPDRERKLLEIRETLEIRIAALAAERRTAEDLRAIEENLDEYENHQEDLERCAVLDLAFHELLAVATRNEVFTVMLGPLDKLLLESRRLELQRSGPTLALETHRRIFEAVRAREPYLAASQMGDHIRLTIGELSKQALKEERAAATRGQASRAARKGRRSG